MCIAARTYIVIVEIVRCGKVMRSSFVMIKQAFAGDLFTDQCFIWYSKGS